MSSNNIYNHFYELNTQINKFYFDRYVKFIESMKNQTLPSSYHNHHILPKCLFPKYKNFKEYPWNCIPLSFKAHRIAHKLLTKAFPTTSLNCALNFFNIDKISGTNWYNDGIRNIRTDEFTAKTYNLSVGRMSVDVWKIKLMYLKTEQTFKFQFLNWKNI